MGLSKTQTLQQLSNSNQTGFIGFSLMFSRLKIKLNKIVSQLGCHIKVLHGGSTKFRHASLQCMSKFSWATVYTKNIFRGTEGLSHYDNTQPPSRVKNHTPGWPIVCKSSPVATPCVNNNWRRATLRDKLSRNKLSPVTKNWPHTKLAPVFNSMDFFFIPQIFDSNLPKIYV